MIISSKELHVAIKRGDVLEEVAKRHGVTVDQIIDYIRTNMKAGANNLLRDFDKNEKARQRENRRNEKNTQEVDSSVAEATPELEVEDSEAETTVASSDTSKESEEETSSITSLSPLEVLKKDEEEFSQKLRELEIAHESLQDRRRKILTEAQELSQKVISLQQALQEAEAKVEVLNGEYYALAESMTTNTTERRDYEALLSEVREEIEELTKVIVKVKEDGTIECNHPEILDTLSAEEEASELSRLMSIPEAEDMTLKLLRAIARSKILEKLGATIEYQFPFGGNQQS